MICHLSALAGFIGIPFGNILGPLIWWNIKKKESAEVDWHGKEALNFQITATLAALVCVPLMFIVIGIPLMFAIGIGALVLTIISGLKANEGIRKPYPFTIRFIK